MPNANLTTATTAISAAQVEFDALSSQVQSLSAERDLLASQLATANSTIATQQTTINTLNSTIAARDSEIVTLKARIRELEQQLNPLPKVKPIWSHRLWEKFGVCAHPNFGTAGNVYENIPYWMAHAADLGCNYIRGMYPDVKARAVETANLCRQNNMKWVCTVTPESWNQTESELLAKLAHLRDNAADVILAIEGPNEPNEAADPNWVQKTLIVEQTIDQFLADNGPTMGHIKHIGTSLHAVQETQAQLNSLRDAGLGPIIDAIGLHRYTGGRPPGYLLDERVGWRNNSFPGKEVFCTETGFHNALNTTAGHNPVTEEVAGVYLPRALFKYVADKNVACTVYELEDDSNSLIAHEERFGLVRRDGTKKPAFVNLKALLANLKDAGPVYDPPEVGVKIEAPADVSKYVVANRTGKVTVYLVRHETTVWDQNARTPLTVAPVSVKVTDVAGERTISVGANVASLTLRT